MRRIAVLAALAVVVLLEGCRGFLPASTGLVAPRETSPSRLLIEQTLAGMGFHDITRLTATSWDPSPHGLSAYFQATAVRDTVVFRISGYYDALAGVIIQSLVPTGHS
jgi:hypothetical protein